MKNEDLLKILRPFAYRGWIEVSPEIRPRCKRPPNMPETEELLGILNCGDLGQMAFGAEALYGTNGKPSSEKSGLYRIPFRIPYSDFPNRKFSADSKVIKVGPDEFIHAPFLGGSGREFIPKILNRIQRFIHSGSVDASEASELILVAQRLLPGKRILNAGIGCWHSASSRKETFWAKIQTSLFTFGFGSGPTWYEYGIIATDEKMLFLASLGQIAGVEINSGTKDYDDQGIDRMFASIPTPKTVSDESLQSITIRFKEVEDYSLTIQVIGSLTTEITMLEAFCPGNVSRGTAMVKQCHSAEAF